VHPLAFHADVTLASLDLVEVNPLEAVQNRTAELATELILSALGKTILKEDPMRVIPSGTLVLSLAALASCLLAASCSTAVKREQARRLEGDWYEAGQAQPYAYLIRNGGGVWSVDLRAPGSGAHVAEGELVNVSGGRIRFRTWHGIAYTDADYTLSEDGATLFGGTCRSNQGGWRGLKRPCGNLIRR
jgi:hypothetical protein